MKKFALISTVIAAALIAVVVATAASGRQFRLQPVGASNVRGTGTVRSLGAETGLSLALRGFPGAKKFHIVMNAGTCSHRSTSVDALGDGKSRPDGTARTASLIRHRGMPLAFKKVADGRHVIAIILGTKTVACGAIPA